MASSAAATVSSITASVNSTNVESVQLGDGVPRYGHTSAYLPQNNTLLLIGGQGRANGTQSTEEITSSVLSFNIGSEFVWGASSASSAPDNPTDNKVFQKNLVPNVWSTSAVLPGSNDVWLVGGVVDDCADEQEERQTRVQVLRSPRQGWLSLDVTGSVPPRRRMAKAVAVRGARSSNKTSSTTKWHHDVLVFGGIRDSITCSQVSKPYRGIDRYSPHKKSVKVIPWKLPVNLQRGEKTFEPAVADFAAVAINKERSVILIGGQLANGSLMSTDRLLEFDVVHEMFTLRQTSGQGPSQVIGHTANLVAKDGVLVFGGLNASHTIMSDSYLLNTTTWAWSRLKLSNKSIDAPARAWHSADFVSDSTLVVAFGIDETDLPSSAFMFLTRQKDGSWSWQDTYEPRVEPVKLAANLVMNPKLDPTPDVEAPIATSSSSTDPVTGDAPSSTSDESSPASTTAVIASLPSESLSIAPHTILPPTLSSSAEPATAPSSMSVQTKSIVAGVSSLAGLAVVVAVAFFFVRRRQSNSSSADADRHRHEMSEDSPLSPSGVANMLFTRKSIGRALSLGSTMSHAQKGSVSSYAATDPFQDGASFDERFEDPFSDVHDINELGQISPVVDFTRTNTLDTLRPPQRVMSVSRRTRPDSRELETLVASPAMSVQSQPFLRALFRTESLSRQGDHLTVPFRPQQRSLHTRTEVDGGGMDDESMYGAGAASMTSRTLRVMNGTVGSATSQD